VTILQQNWGGAGRTVSELDLPLDDLKRGTVVFYRPYR
jgi:hypothetical protein